MVLWLSRLKWESSQFLRQVINKAYLGNQHFSCCCSLLFFKICHISFSAGELEQELSQDTTLGHLVSTWDSEPERVFFFFSFHFFGIIPLNPVQLRKSPQYVQINKANILQADFLSWVLEWVIQSNMNPAGFIEILKHINNLYGDRDSQKIWNLQNITYINYIHCLIQEV